jgi:hypothetical protein
LFAVAPCFSFVAEIQESMRAQKTLLICGILSSLLYVAMNIFVPLWDDSYNSFSQTISELSAIDAPTRLAWVIPGILYTILVAAFGWGIRRSAGQNRKLRIAGDLLFAYGIIGIGWTFAPMHKREVLAAGGATVSDTVHLYVMSTISSLFMLISMGFAAAAFGKWFRIYSIISILSLLFYGAITASYATKVEKDLPTPWLGVIERLMIGVFLLWAVMLALLLLQKMKITVPHHFQKDHKFKQ